MQQPQFQRVTIIGVGLLGASLGLTIKRQGAALRVIGVGRAESRSLQKALEIGAIDETTTDPHVGVRDSDLVVLAVNVGQFASLMQTIARSLKSGALVTDVGSTKQQVLKWAGQWLPDTVDFIGSHPMAGSEKRGPDHARADLYHDALCLICPPKIRGRGAFTGKRVDAALEKMERFWRSLGMRTAQLDARTHDQWVALISHIPHAAACMTALVAGRTPEAAVAIAGGFVDITRVAAGDPAMWADIFLTNRLEMNKNLRIAIQTLRKLQSAIRRSDVAAVKDFLQAAKEQHELLLARRNAR
ncbi:MAG: prephenate dehydrogenase [Phycisphaerae bacterium]